MTASASTPTGAQLIVAIEAEARRRNLTVARFIEPLTPHPQNWLKQLAIAKRPKPLTVERVRALLEGAPIPDAPANNFQRGPAASASPAAPAPTLASIATSHPDLARQLKLEADRAGKALPTFLAELVALGWLCYVEDLREAAL